MDASGHGKHVSVVGTHLKEANQILDMGVNEELSEEVALLCADTQLMLAEFELERARASIRRRMGELNNV